MLAETFAVDSPPIVTEPNERARGCGGAAFAVPPTLSKRISAPASAVAPVELRLDGYRDPNRRL